MAEMFSESQEGRVEALSKKIGGRFKLTAIVQKQMREYVRGGRAFMPSVRNTHELVDLILDMIENDELDLTLAAEEAPESLEESIFKEPEPEAAAPEEEEEDEDEDEEED